MARKYKERVVKFKENNKVVETTYKTRKGAERLYNKLVKQVNPMLEAQGKSKYMYGSAKGKTMHHLDKQIKYMAGVVRRDYIGMSTGRYKQFLEKKINDALTTPMDDEMYDSVSKLQMIVEDMSDYAFEKFYEYIDANHPANKRSIFELETYYSGKAPSISEKAEQIIAYLEEFAYTLNESSTIRETILNYM